MQPTMSLSDEELIIADYEEITKIATGLAHTDDTRPIDAFRSSGAVEDEELYLGMDKATSVLPRNKCYT